MEGAEMTEPCTQLENIGTLKEAALFLKDAVSRLDKRINGTFDTIGEHIKESPYYRGKIDVLENEIKNIKQEKNNTTKNAQWRIGIIVGLICAFPSLVMMIIQILKYLNGK